MRLPKFLVSFLFSTTVYERPGSSIDDQKASTSWRIPAVPIEEQKVVASWTIPISISDQPTPTEKILESRETASWINPQPNPQANEIFTIGDVVDVQWTTDFDFYEIYLWQQSLTAQFATADSDPIYIKSEEDTEEGGFNWTATTGVFELSDSNVFFFSLGQNQTLTGVFTDHYFNLTEKATTTTSKTASKTTSTTKTPTTSSTSSPATTTTSPSTTTTSSSSTIGVGLQTSTSTSLPVTQASTSSISSGTKLGVGVGLGLGIPLILLLAALVYLKIKQLRNVAKPNPPSPTSESAAQETHLMQNGEGAQMNELSAGPGGNVQPTSFYNKDWRRAELPEGNGVSELDGRGRSELA